MFLLVPAYPGCPGQMAVKWLLLSNYQLLYSTVYFTDAVLMHRLMQKKNYNCLQVKCHKVHKLTWFLPHNGCLIMLITGEKQLRPDLP